MIGGPQIALQEIFYEQYAMIREQQMPAAVNDARCKKCSLLETCAPAVAARPARIERLYDDLFTLLPVDRELARSDS